MGRDHSDNVRLAHYNMFSAPLTADPDLTEQEMHALRRKDRFIADGIGYSDIQSTRVCVCPTRRKHLDRLPYSDPDVHGLWLACYHWICDRCFSVVPTRLRRGEDGRVVRP